MPKSIINFKDKLGGIAQTIQALPRFTEKPAMKEPIMAGFPSMGM